MSRPKGFTLIELLVVIAIIALLLSILMLSLQQVSKQAQAVACQSNIKQWSYCWHMYLDEHNGKFPTGDRSSGDWPDDRFWKDRNQKKADNIPLFTDCVFVDTFPTPGNAPPRYDGIVENEMQLVRINRHNGIVNMVFLDLNVRKVGLKELWTFNWSSVFDIHGPWTKAGGVESQDWPQWMSTFKDY